MKRILIILLLMILMPVMVNADMGAPVIKPYEAYVVDVNGADYYEYYHESVDNRGYRKVGMLEHDTKINVNYETDFNDDIYAYFELNDSYYYILVKDIMPVKDEFIIDESVDDNYIGKSDDEIEITVLEKDGIRMHKGPASAYLEVGDVIPKGTKLKYKYVAGDTWYYVEYNGVNGWILQLDGVVGKYQEETIIISKDLEITIDDEIVGMVPGNTILNNYYSVDPWSWKYYITYNGISGYVDLNSVAILREEKSIISKNVKKLYEKADLNSNVLVEDISLDTTFTYNYMLGRHFIEWIYTTYNGKTGWVNYTFEESEFGGSGETLENDVNTNDDENEIIDDIMDSTDENEIIKQNDRFTEKQILFLSIGAAIVISLTTFVIVVLVNKKRS